MALVPSLDLRQDDGDGDSGSELATHDAEIAVLGIAMYEQESIDSVAGLIAPEHFSEPLFGAIWNLILTEHADGERADPLLIAEHLRRNEGFKEIGGLGFLADAVVKAPPARDIEQYAKLILEGWRRRQLIGLGARMMRLARAAGGATDEERLKAEEIIREAEDALLGLQAGDTRLNLTSLAQAADEVIAYVLDRSVPDGVHTGLGPLHRLIGLLLAGELYLIAGRPGMGKSALACCLALRIAAPEWWREHDDLGTLDDDAAARFAIELPSAAGVLEISGEMSRGQMTRRHYADIGHALFGSAFPTYENIRRKHVTAEQIVMMERARDIMRTWPLQMMKRSGLKVSELRSIARRQFAEWRKQGIRPGVLIIDHAGLLRAENPKLARTEAQTQIAIDLHTLAEELGVPIIVLVQLNREVEKRDDKRPQLHDLKDSGGWEENADVVVFPYRDSYYAQREPEPPLEAEGGNAWAVWDRRCRSHDLELIPGKIREGNVGRPATAWMDVAYNAARAAEPVDRGRML